MWNGSRLVRPILVLVLLAISPVSFSQSENSIMARYDKENLPPDQLFLPKFLEHITSAALQQPTRDEQVSYIGTNLLLKNTVSAQAEEYLILFIAVRDENRYGKEEFIRENLCPLNSTRPTGDEFLQKLNGVDSNNDDIGAIGLTTLRQSMSSSAYGAFLAWMNRVKTTSNIVRIDHKISHASRDMDAYSQAYCGRFDSNVSNKRPGD